MAIIECNECGLLHDANSSSCIYLEHTDEVNNFYGILKHLKEKEVLRKVEVLNNGTKLVYHFGGYEYIIAIKALDER